MPAIVLSGGGSKGAFEVGAVRFLYNQNVRPNILCGVSVGAINAAKLAEGENDADPTQGLPGLEAIWSSLLTNSDMYSEQSWLSDPRMHPAVRDYLTGRTANLSVTPPPEDRGPFPNWEAVAKISADISQLGWLMDQGAALLRSLSLVAGAVSLYNLQPIESRLTNQLDGSKVAAWAAAGGLLRLGMVGLESGRLRWVTETGNVIERNGEAVLDLTPPTICVNERNIVEGLEQEIRDLQEELLSATGGTKRGLGSGIRSLQQRLPQARENLSTCIRAAAQASPLPQPARADLRRAVLASASIPGLFPPVGIAGETYVDGGVREVLPAREALRLGTDVIYAISASPPEIDRAPRSFARARMFEIVGRALTEIMVNEVSQGDVLEPRRPPFTGEPLSPRPPIIGEPVPRPDIPLPGGIPGVSARSAAPPYVIAIYPTVDLYPITTVDPGLIQINRDYGYMRAADAWADIRPETRQWWLSDEIARVRLETWYLENLVAGRADPRRPDLPPPAANPSVQATVDTNKQALNNLLQERQRLAGVGGMPAGIFDWVTNAERHP
jgi:NTE family protein